MGSEHVKNKSSGVVQTSLTLVACSLGLSASQLGGASELG